MANTVKTQWFINPISGQRYQATGNDIEYQRQRKMIPISGVEEIAVGDDTTAERIAKNADLINSDEVKALAASAGLKHEELSLAEKLLLAKIQSANNSILGRPDTVTSVVEEDKEEDVVP